jgi:hypothetical protein
MNNTPFSTVRSSLSQVPLDLHAFSTTVKSIVPGTLPNPSSYYGPVAGR